MPSGVVSRTAAGRPQQGPLGIVVTALVDGSGIGYVTALQLRHTLATYALDNCGESPS